MFWCRQYDSNVVLGCPRVELLRFKGGVRVSVDLRDVVESIIVIRSVSNDKVLDGSGDGGCFFVVHSDQDEVS